MIKHLNIGKDDLANQKPPYYSLHANSTQGPTSIANTYSHGLRLGTGVKQNCGHLHSSKI